MEFLDQRELRATFILQIRGSFQGSCQSRCIWDISGRVLAQRSAYTVAARLASLPMSDLHLVHALGLDAPPRMHIDRGPAAPIFVPRWNRPPAPVVQGGNGAGHVNVVEANVGEANVGAANVGEADLQSPAAAPEGPAGDGVGSLVSAESSGVRGTKPDDPPAQPEDSAGAGVKQTEAKEGKNPGASEKP